MNRFEPLIAAILTLGPVFAAAQPPYPIAGLAPFGRPVMAPSITEPMPIERSLALHGVSEPIPPSLRFLDHQGGWYNPFLHPGMTGPYDLRGWHASSHTVEARQK